MSADVDTGVVQLGPAAARKRLPGCCMYWRSPFFLAVEEGDVEEVTKFLLENPLWLKQTDKKERRTAWHVAATHGHVEVLRALVTRTREDDAAAVWNSQPTLSSRIRAVTIATRDQGGGPDERVAEMVNGRASWGLTPLMLAAERDQAAAVRYLLSVGADPWQGDQEGRNPAHHAAKAGAVHALQVLMEQDSPPSARASARNNPGTRYVDSLDSYGFTPLHYATWANCRPAMMLLVGFDANIIVRTVMVHNDYYNLPAGSTPLHIACLLGDLDRVKLLLRAYYETAADLLPSHTALLGTVERRRRARSHPDPRLILTRTQRLPFHIAARAGHRHLLDWLDPSIPLMFLFGGEEETTGEGREGGGGSMVALVGVSRLTVIAAKALHQALLDSLDVAAEDIRRYEEAAEARRQRREARRLAKEAEVAAQQLKQGKEPQEPPPEGIRGRIRRLIERASRDGGGTGSLTAVSVTTAAGRGTDTGGGGGATAAGAAAPVSSGWRPWRSRGALRRGRRKVTASGVDDAADSAGQGAAAENGEAGRKGQGQQQHGGAMRSPRRRRRRSALGAAPRGGGGAAAAAAGATPQRPAPDVDETATAAGAGADGEGHPTAVSRGGDEGGGGRAPEAAADDDDSNQDDARGRLHQPAVIAAAAPQSPTSQPPLPGSPRNPPGEGGGFNASMRLRIFRTSSSQLTLRTPPQPRVSAAGRDAGPALPEEPEGPEPAISPQGTLAGGPAGPSTAAGASGGGGEGALNSTAGGGAGRSLAASLTRTMLQRLYRGSLRRQGSGSGTGGPSVDPSQAQLNERLNRAGITIPEGPDEAVAYFTPGREPRYNMPTQILLPGSAFSTGRRSSDTLIPGVGGVAPPPSVRSGAVSPHQLVGVEEGDETCEDSATSASVPAVTSVSTDIAVRGGGGGEARGSEKQGTAEAPAGPGGSDADVGRVVQAGGTSGSEWWRLESSRTVSQSTSAMLAEVLRRSSGGGGGGGAGAGAAVAAGGGGAAASSCRGSLDVASVDGGASHISAAADNAAARPAASPAAACLRPGSAAAPLRPRPPPLTAPSLDLEEASLPADDAEAAGGATPAAPDSLADQDRGSAGSAAAGGRGDAAGSAGMRSVGSSQVPSRRQSLQLPGAAVSPPESWPGSPPPYGLRAPPAVRQSMEQALESLQQLQDHAAAAEAGAAGAAAAGAAAAAAAASDDGAAEGGMAAGALQLLNSLRNTLRRASGQHQAQVVPVTRRSRSPSPVRGGRRRRHTRAPDSPRRNGRPAAAALGGSAAPAPAAAAPPPPGPDGTRSPNASYHRGSAHSHHHHNLAAGRGVRVASGRPHARISLFNRVSPGPAEGTTGAGPGQLGRRQATAAAATQSRGRTAASESGSEGGAADATVAATTAGTTGPGAAAAVAAAAGVSPRGCGDGGTAALGDAAAAPSGPEAAVALTRAAHTNTCSVSFSSSSSSSSSREEERAAAGGAAGGDDDEDVCPVCLDEAPNLLVQACRHQICMDCARDLIKRHGLTPALCPYCRGIISSFKARVTATTPGAIRR